MSKFTSTVSVLVTLTIETDNEPTDDQLVDAGCALRDSVENALVITKVVGNIKIGDAHSVDVHFDDHDIYVDEYPSREEE